MSSLAYNLALNDKRKRAVLPTRYPAQTTLPKPTPITAPAPVSSPAPITSTSTSTGTGTVSGISPLASTLATQYPLSDKALNSLPTIPKIDNPILPKIDTPPPPTSLLPVMPDPTSTSASTEPPAPLPTPPPSVKGASLTLDPTSVLANTLASKQSPFENPLDITTSGITPGGSTDTTGNMMPSGKDGTVAPPATPSGLQPGGDTSNRDDTTDIASVTSGAVKPGEEPPPSDTRPPMSSNVPDSTQPGTNPPETTTPPTEGQPGSSVPGTGEPTHTTQPALDLGSDANASTPPGAVTDPYLDTETTPGVTTTPVEGGVTPGTGIPDTSPDTSTTPPTDSILSDQDFNAAFADLMKGEEANKQQRLGDISTQASLYARNALEQNALQGGGMGGALGAALAQAGLGAAQMRSNEAAKIDLDNKQMRFNWLKEQLASAEAQNNRDLQEKIQNEMNTLSRDIEAAKIAESGRQFDIWFAGQNGTETSSGPTTSLGGVPSASRTSEEQEYYDKVNSGEIDPLAPLEGGSSSDPNSPSFDASYLNATQAKDHTEADAYDEFVAAYKMNHPGDKIPSYTYWYRNLYEGNGGMLGDKGVGTTTHSTDAEGELPPGTYKL